jgi:hypothetical protein
MTTLTDRTGGPTAICNRNIIWHNDRIAAVIDWDRIRVRPFAEEIVRTATIQFETPHGLDLDRVAAFVAGYRSVMPITSDALADGVHRMWWKRMPNYWHLVCHCDRDDHGCDDLFLSGEALLHWWTAHRPSSTTRSHRPTDASGKPPTTPRAWNGGRRDMPSTGYT